MKSLASMERGFIIRCILYYITCWLYMILILGFLLNMAYAGECNSCIDGIQYSNQCPGWAQTGECDKNRKFMSFWCRRSCEFCN